VGIFDVPSMNTVQVGTRIPSNLNERLTAYIKFLQEDFAANYR
jgi:hypothetical protein